MKILILLLFVLGCYAQQIVYQIPFNPQPVDYPRFLLPTGNRVYVAGLNFVTAYSLSASPSGTWSSSQLFPAVSVPTEVNGVASYGTYAVFITNNGISFFNAAGLFSSYSNANIYFLDICVAQDANNNQLAYALGIQNPVSGHGGINGTRTLYRIQLRRNVIGLTKYYEINDPSKRSTFLACGELNSVPTAVVAFYAGSVYRIPLSGTPITTVTVPFGGSAVEAIYTPQTSSFYVVDDDKRVFFDAISGSYLTNSIPVNKTIYHASVNTDDVYLYDSSLTTSNSIYQWDYTCVSCPPVALFTGYNGGIWSLAAEATIPYLYVGFTSTIAFIDPLYLSSFSATAGNIVHGNTNTITIVAYDIFGNPRYFRDTFTVQLISPSFSITTLSTVWDPVNLQYTATTAVLNVVGTYYVVVNGNAYASFVVS